jgi:tetratricopeptide (TPR) repeat protein
MNDSPSRSTANQFSGYLEQSHTDVEAGKYLEALASAQKAKDLEPKNIYVLALEKQIEQLIELSAGNALTDEQRTDILESIPGIIDRAIEGAPPEEPSDEGREVSEPRPVREGGREDRAAALEWLKNQYFQQAHDFVQEGEYDNALAEIRRVFIIEAENETAKQFEKHILELADLHREIPAPPVPPPAAPAPPARPAESPAVSESPASPSVETVKAETRQQAEKARPRRRGFTVLIVGIILVAMAFIGYGLIQLWLRENVEPSPRTEPPEVLSPQPEIYYNEDAQTTARSTDRASQPVDSTRDSTQARRDTSDSPGN